MQVVTANMNSMLSCYISTSTLLIVTDGIWLVYAIHKLPAQFYLEAPLQKLA